MKIIHGIFLLLGALAVFGAGWYFGAQNESVDSVPDKVEMTENVDQELRRERDALRQQLSEMQQAQDALEQGLMQRLEEMESPRQAAREYPSEDDIIEPDGTDDSDFKEELQSMNRRQHEMSRRFEEDPEYNPMGALAEQFSAEPVNEDWAYDRESLLWETFAVAPDLQGSVLNGLECRSERCRIELLYQSENEISVVTGALARYLMTHHMGVFAPSIMSHHSFDAENVLYIYLGEDADALFIH